MLTENQIFNGYVELRCPKCGFRQLFYVGNNPNNNTLKETYNENDRWCGYCDEYLFDDLSTTMSVSNWSEGDILYVLAKINSIKLDDNLLQSNVYLLQKILLENNISNEKKRIKIIKDYFSQCIHK